MKNGEERKLVFCNQKGLYSTFREARQRKLVTPNQNIYWILLAYKDAVILIDEIRWLLVSIVFAARSRKKEYKR